MNCAEMKNLYKQMHDDVRRRRTAACANEWPIKYAELYKAEHSVVDNNNVVANNATTQVAVEEVMFEEEESYTIVPV
jgi:hypothetical protein